MSELDDTTPAAEAVLHELYRGMTREQKLRLVFEHQASVDSFALAGIRLRHPDAGERELVLRLAALRYPREVMLRVFDWDPREKGY